MMLNVVHDVIAHLHTKQIYPIISQRGGKKGVVDGSSLSATEVAQLVILDTIVSSIDQGIGWSLKASDISRQLSQLSPNYVQQFLGSLVTLGFLDVKTEGNAYVYAPNMELKLEESLYILLGSPMALGSAGASGSTMKTGRGAIMGNLLLRSPRSTLSPDEELGITTMHLSGYWMIGYNYQDFLTDNQITIFAAFSFDRNALKLKETWLAINGSSPERCQAAGVFLGTETFWSDYTPDRLNAIGATGAISAKEVQRQAFSINKATPVSTPIPAPAPAPVTETSPETDKYEDKYVPHRPAEFTKPVGNPFEGEAIKTNRFGGYGKSIVQTPVVKTIDKTQLEEIKIKPPSVNWKNKTTPQPKSEAPTPTHNTAPVASKPGTAQNNAKRKHIKSDTLVLVEEMLSSGMTSQAKDKLLEAIIKAQAYELTKELMK